MTALERRYRRLLAWYPKDHRAQHEEEMLAVLLAASAPGRNRPAVRDAFDLVRGGLAIRLRRVVPLRSRRVWRAAVDLAALLAPLVLFGAGLFRVAGYAGRFAFDLAVPVLVDALPYGLVVLLAWLGRRWAAIACAWALAALHATMQLVQLLSLPEGTVVVGDVILVSGRPVIAASMLLSALPACVCAAMLTLAPSPGPGPVGSRRLLLWAGGVLAACVGGVLLPKVFGAVLMLAALGTVAVMALRFTTGRRTAAVLMPLLVVAVMPSWFTDPASLTGVAAATAALLGATAWLARTGEPA
ncbi:hypothetical protein GBF35_27270 [Nonomuraea phyllanthi]|uniref:hypothetical protein n=1 Tax=Nonomuraea phyllanthi TaxID=2219224 RepID=UPI001293ABA0|nr:hypothetical protein [Nonomuraea phyllanthi]QFY09859.1 hypothetical protein GBF35_27270 [Nonomuraea phyllanthi]